MRIPFRSRQVEKAVDFRQHLLSVLVKHAGDMDIVVLMVAGDKGGKIINTGKEKAQLPHGSLRGLGDKGSGADFLPERAFRPGNAAVVTIKPQPAEADEIRFCFIDHPGGGGNMLLPVVPAAQPQKYIKGNLYAGLLEPGGDLFTMAGDCPLR